MATSDQQAQAGPSAVSATTSNGVHAGELLGRAGLSAYEASLPPSDALPYHDDELSRPGMQAKVERELAAEMQKASAGSAKDVAEDRLPPTIELFANNEHLRAEFERVAAGTAREGGIDKARYRLAAPQDGTQASEEAWLAAIRNAEAQLMHSEGRLTNLELMKRFGANHWRLHNFQQEAFVRSFEQASAQLQAETANINRARKQEQSGVAGPELVRLSKRWAELLNRSLSVELANVVAAAEIEDLEVRRAELQSKLAAMD